MPLPKKIKVGCFTYTISEMEDVRSDSGEPLFGQHRPLDQEIRLLKDMTPERAKEVLIHEILHAIWNVYDLPRKGDEHIVQCIGQGLATILADNPKLRRYLDENH